MKYNRKDVWLGDVAYHSVAPKHRGGVMSVIDFNGMILYGIDNSGNGHNEKWLIKRRDGGLRQSGQVAYIVDSDGALVSASVVQNRAAGWHYINERIPSRGIIA